MVTVQPPIRLSTLMFVRPLRLLQFVFHTTRFARQATGLLGLLTLSTTCLLRADEVYGDYNYEDNGDGTCVILQYNGNASTLAVPSVIAGLSVTDIGQFAFSQTTPTLTQITLPTTLEAIEIGAFYECTELQSIDIPNSVTQLAKSVFYGCTNLKSVSLPSSITGIEPYTFYRCTSLDTIRVPANVTVIGEHAFERCSALTQANFSGDAPVMGSAVFDNTADGFTVYYQEGALGFTSPLWEGYLCLVDSNNTSDPADFSTTANGDGTCTITRYSGDGGDIVIPDTINGLTVTTIDRNVFLGKSTITSVYIPDSVTDILYGAFYLCSNLTHASISANIESIEGYAFDSCSLLKTVLFRGQAPTIASRALGSTAVGLVVQYYVGAQGFTEPTWNGYTSEAIELPWADFAYTSNGTNVTTITGYIGNGGDITVPAQIEGMTVVAIGDKAFYDNDSITSVTLPDSILVIGDYAFQSCQNLAAITLSENLSSIGRYAFKYTSSLSSISLPENLSSLGIQAFERCASLTEITIPSNVTVIQTGTFSNCAKLSAVILPNGLTSIDNAAFFKCTDLTDITLPPNLTSVGTQAFEGCSSLSAITIPNQITILPHGVFADCTALQSVNLPSQLTVIDDYAFNRCSSLESLEVPNSLETIRTYAFSQCEKLASINLPENLTSIGQGAFSHCTALTRVDVPPQITRLEAYTFWRCTNLQAVTLPEDISVIDLSAFDECQKLETINLPAALTRISAFAFSGCENLTDLAIPCRVTSIQNSAFKNCTALDKVLFQGNAPVLEEQAFEGTADGFTVYYYTSAKSFTTPTWEGYPSVALPVTSYTIWQGLMLGDLEENMQIPNADADLDGMSNFIEYALGGDPQSPNHKSSPSLGLIHNRAPSLTFQMREAATDAVYTVQRSSNLLDNNAWEPIVIYTPAGEGNGFTRTDTGNTANVELQDLGDGLFQCIELTPSNDDISFYRVAISPAD